MQPYHVSRCAATSSRSRFLSAFWKKRASPTGVRTVSCSKGADDPSDKLSDELLKSRDGELFNIRIQGPAVTSSWCGEPDMEVMPLDKMFVLIVADVWWGDLSPKNIPAGDSDAGEDEEKDVERRRELCRDGGARQARLPAEVPSSEMLRDYLKGRDQCLNCVTGEGLKKEQMESDTNDSFRRKQARAYQAGERTRLCNFRVKLATSSQMINFSAPGLTASATRSRKTSPPTSSGESTTSRAWACVWANMGASTSLEVPARAHSRTHTRMHAHAHARMRTRAHTPQVGASATSSTRRRRVRPFLRPGPTSACARRPTRWPSTST